MGRKTWQLSHLAQQSLCMGIPNEIEVLMIAIKDVKSCSNDLQIIV